MIRTVNDLITLRDQLVKIGRCDLTSTLVFEFLYGRTPNELDSTDVSINYEIRIDDIDCAKNLYNSLLGLEDIKIDGITYSVIDDSFINTRNRLCSIDMSPPKMSSIDYVMSVINYHLDSYGSCIIRVMDGSEDGLLVHYFIIFKIENNYFRMESYAQAIKGQEWTPFPQYETRYCTRIIEWKSYDNDMRILITSRDNRLRIWNLLFSVDEEDNEEIDIESDLYVTIYTPYKLPNP